MPLIREVAAAFLKLGLTSFGGPIAHLGYFHAEFVQRRKWLSDDAYADLVALCQFLPGPSSSQVAFALGMRRAGIGGAIAASACFLLPSAALMIAFAYGFTKLTNVENAGWIHGLKLAAVAVVAQAVWQMWRKLCPTFATSAIAIVAAALVLTLRGPWTQVAVIAAAAFLGKWLLQADPSRASGPEAPPSSLDVHGNPDDSPGRLRGSAPIAAILLFAALLLILPLAARLSNSHNLAVFDSFYRSGSLVFGGGHVVLPLLREELVPRGWVSDDAFLAGYGAAQAAPGPLFSFAGYLGALIYTGPHAWLGGIWCLVAIFLPAWLLIGGALPFWSALRARKWAQSALRGANAAVVGVLLAALISPVGAEGIGNPRDLAAALFAFLLLQSTRVPPVVVVALCAVAGQWLL